MKIGDIDLGPAEKIARIQENAYFCFSHPLLIYEDLRKTKQNEQTFTA